MTRTGTNRAQYAATVEPSPSRFANEGRDYRDWAARADEWARGNAYLMHLPAQVVALSARITDAVLLESWETIDAASRSRTALPVQLAGVGTVEPGSVPMVWGWLVDVVKSRHTVEWETINERGYAEIREAAATAQGVAAEDVDWDVVPGDVFDGKPTALACAVEVLRSHVLAAATR